MSRRAFFALTVLPLVLCVGGTAVLFAIVNALWLRPRLPGDQHRVVLVTAMNQASGSDEGHFLSESSIERELRGLPAFQAVAGQVAASGVNRVFYPRVALASVGHEVETLGVTWEYFSVMGLSVTGRDFAQDDDLFGATPTAILSDRLWRRYFGASRQIIGAEIAAIPEPVRVIGIAPSGFHGARLGEQVDLWLPRHIVPRFLSMAPPMDAFGGLPLLAVARLAPDWSAERAEALLARQAGNAQGLAAKRVIPIAQIYGSSASRTVLIKQDGMLWLTSAAAGLLAFAGCATVMALILVYYEHRRQELALRMALGCSRTRLCFGLIRELLPIPVGTLGGAWLLVLAVLRALPSVSLPGGVELQRIDLRTDWNVLAFGVAATVIIQAVAMALPLWRATRLTVIQELSFSSERTTPSSSGLRRVILTAHVCASVAVVLTAGLFLQAVAEAYNQGGSRMQEVIFAEARIGSPYETAEMRETRVGRDTTRVMSLMESLTALPAVDSVSIGRAPTGLDQAAAASHAWALTSGSVVRPVPGYLMADVGSAYFDALQVPIVAGRTLLDADAWSTSRPESPVVVTRTLAEAVWPGGHAVGESIRPLRSPISYRVVGVVDNIRVGSLRMGHDYAIFRSVTAAQAVSRHVFGVVVRTRKPDLLVDPVRNAMIKALPSASQVSVVTGHELVARDVGREILGAWFFAGFGVIAMVLVIGSVFGLSAELVASRRREIGVRLALGATPAQVVRQVVTIGLRPVAIGSIGGLGIGLLFAIVLESIVIGLGTPKLVTAIAVVTLTLASATAACLLASWPVFHLAPQDTLRR